VLHHRPYRDTSRILELFTRDHGRVSVFARGARASRKNGSSLMSVLQPFHALLVSWSGRGEAGQLTHAEFGAAIVDLSPERCVSGFYLNELILKLFARQDPHPEIYDLYAETVARLKAEPREQPALRLFEKRLLDGIGYGLSLETEALTGRPVEAGRLYQYRLEQGPQELQGVAEHALALPGASLLAVAQEDFSDPQVCADARLLLRAALDRALEGRELNSRAVLKQLKRL
jgi:DNA repair protein RecO (recombination protein O)